MLFDVYFFLSILSTIMGVDVIAMSVLCKGKGSAFATFVLVNVVGSCVKG